MEGTNKTHYQQSKGLLWKEVPTESHTVTKHTVLEVERKPLESYSGVVQIFILPPFTDGFRESQRFCASVPTICSKNTVLGEFKYLFPESERLGH